MPGTEIIDMHFHLCRDTQQEKTVFPKKGWPDDWFYGSPDTVIPFMDAHGISYVATMNVMVTNAMIEARVRRAREQGATEEAIAQARIDLKEDMKQRVRQMNDWTLEAQKKEPRIIVYAAIDPVLFGDETMDELERCIALGAQGIKIHPSNYRHYPDHPTMMQVYERLQSAGLGALTDTSSRQSPDGNAYGVPLGWRPVLQAFPHLKLIQAHLAGDMWDDQIDLAREFPDNLWFDIAGGWVDDHHPPSGHAGMLASQAVRVLRKIGIERVMHGSDGPPLDPMSAAEQIMRMEFTDAEKEQLLSGNAKQFFGLK